MKCNRVLLSVFLLAAQADAIFLQPQHNAADWTTLRTHVPSKYLVNATSLVQIAERTKHSLKDELRLRAMRRLQDRLQNKIKEKVQGAASADAGVTDSLGSSDAVSQGTKNVDGFWRRRRRDRRRAPAHTANPPRRRGTNCRTGEYGTLLGKVANSALCMPEFPTLEMWAGNEGDRCRTKPPTSNLLCPNEARDGKGSPARTWSCPEGCKYAGDDISDVRCIQLGTRDVCAVTTGCRYPHQTMVRQASTQPYINKGNYCQGTSTNWFPPKGCTSSPAFFLLQRGAETDEADESGAVSEGDDQHEHEEQLTDEEDKGDETDESDAVSEGTKSVLSAHRAKNSPGGLPHTWVNSKRGWNNGKVCHVDSPDVRNTGSTPTDSTIRGFWRLVASGTHGTSVAIETGFTSSKSTSISKETTRSFSSSISVSADKSASAGTEASKVGVARSVGYSSSDGESSSNGRSASEAMAQSKTEMVTVQCTDAKQNTMVTTGLAPNKTAVKTQTSMGMEFVYQWVVGNVEYEAKTQHFRCHKSLDGIEHVPQCAPQFCGNRLLNPYCVKSGSGQEGADVRCTR